MPEAFYHLPKPHRRSLKATKGYRLSKPLNTKVTDLLYIDDLKIHAASEKKLNTVLRSTRGKI